MGSYIIPDDNGEGITRVSKGGDCEYVNPEEYHQNAYISIVVDNECDLYVAQKRDLTTQLLKQLHNEAKRDWDEMFSEYMTTVIPQNLLHLLISRKKNEQIRLLKNLTFTTKLWFAFQITAYKTFGYTLSCYNFEGLAKGVDEKDLPQMIVDGDRFRTVGKTKLSTGQLKNVIAHRTVIVAFILDSGNVWHCFFSTFKSMRGEESWNNGTPHWHYISDKFGISRSDLITSIKEGRHPSTPVHIEFKE